MRERRLDQFPKPGFLKYFEDILGDVRVVPKACRPKHMRPQRPWIDTGIVQSDNFEVWLARIEKRMRYVCGFVRALSQRNDRCKQQPLYGCEKHEEPNRS